MTQTEIDELQPGDVVEYMNNIRWTVLGRNGKHFLDIGEADGYVDSLVRENAERDKACLSVSVLVSRAEILGRVYPPVQRWEDLKSGDRVAGFKHHDTKAFDFGTVTQDGVQWDGRDGSRCFSSKDHYRQTMSSVILLGHVNPAAPAVSPLKVVNQLIPGQRMTQELAKLLVVGDVFVARYEPTYTVTGVEGNNVHVVFSGCCKCTFVLSGNWDHPTYAGKTPSPREAALHKQIMELETERDAHKRDATSWRQRYLDANIRGTAAMSQLDDLRAKLKTL